MDFANNWVSQAILWRVSEIWEEAGEGFRTGDARNLGELDSEDKKWFGN